VTLRGGDIKEPEKGGGEGQEGRERRGEEMGSCCQTA